MPTITKDNNAIAEFSVNHCVIKEVLLQGTLRDRLNQLKLIEASPQYNQSAQAMTTSSMFSDSTMYMVFLHVERVLYELLLLQKLILARGMLSRGTHHL